MKNSEIIALSDEEIQEQIKTAQTAGLNLRFAHAISPLENPMRIPQNRKTIARLHTEVRRREIEAGKSNIAK